MEIEALLEEVKGYLKVTWNEEDKEIEDIIKGGQYYLNEKAGVDLHFSTHYKAKQLLKDYCRYVYNHSFELFEVNFGREILTLSVNEGMKKRAAEHSATDTSSI
ncbi:hypothetical protein ACFFGV_19565 [Pontibacillus salicampi]|uniref:Phage gp6-like head-tail connector protein n=1 Tax=Pontibacillus salicampi TaxID=1449801 RepID=A0ABV6LTP0_9BACI